MHFDNNYIGKIFIPKITLEQQKPLVDLVLEIENKIKFSENYSFLENKINEIIYNLFNLSNDNIETIEKNFKGDL